MGILLTNIPTLILIKFKQNIYIWIWMLILINKKLLVGSVINLMYLLKLIKLSLILKVWIFKKSCLLLLIIIKRLKNNKDKRNQVRLPFYKYKIIRLKLLISHLRQKDQMNLNGHSVILFLILVSHLPYNYLILITQDKI